MTGYTNPEIDEQRLASLTADHQRLRRQFNWLVGLLLGMLLLIGGLAAIAIRFLSDKNQLEQQVSTLTAANQVDSQQTETLDSRVDSLSQQINALNQQVPKGLANQLKTNQTQIQNLQNQVKALSTQVTTLEQVNKALQDELQQGPTIQTPEPTNSP